MKILMVDSSKANKYSVWLCTALVEANQDVSLINVKDVKNDNFIFNFLPYSPSKSETQNKFLKTAEYFFYLVWLLNFIRVNKFDVVHFQFLRREGIECLIFPILALFQKNTIFTAHNILPHETGRLDVWYRSILYRNVSKIIVHNNLVKENLLKAFEINPSKVFVVQPVAPHPKPEDQLIPAATARKNLGLNKGDIVLLFFGFIRPYKGVDLLLQAFEDVKRREAPSKADQLKLVVAGKPLNQELENELLSLIERMDPIIRKDIKTVFEFIEEDNIEAFFRASDVVCLPYERIDYSAVSDRAAMYGKPLVTTNVGPFKTVIENRGVGFVSDHNNLQSYSNTLYAALHDLDRLNEMGKQFQKYFIDENSHHSIAASSLKVYGEKLRIEL